MYQKILVPIDGSETSTCGLREAIRLAKDQHAQIRLIHIVDEFVMASPYGIVVDSVIDQLCTAGKSILANAQETVQGTRLRGHIPTR